MESWKLIILGIAAVGGVAAVAYRLLTRPSAEKQLDVSLGEPVEMSGPEFLKMLEAEGPYEIASGRAEISVVLPAEIDPIQRGKRFEEPLANALGEDSDILSGGTMFREENGVVETVSDFTLDVRDREELPNVVRRLLQECDAPPGSTFTISRQGVEGVEDEEYRVYVQDP